MKRSYQFNGREWVSLLPRGNGGPDYDLATASPRRLNFERIVEDSDGVRWFLEMRSSTEIAAFGSSSLVARYHFVRLPTPNAPLHPADRSFRVAPR